MRRVPPSLGIQRDYTVLLTCTIRYGSLCSFFLVATCTAVIYDWALSLGKEYELIWSQRWSLVTILYLGVRYLGMPYTVIYMLESLPSVSVTDKVIVNAMLGIIIITRLHAMYQQSRKILIFLVVIFLVVTGTCGVIAAIGSRYTIGQELILSGSHQCSYSYQGVSGLLDALAWVCYTVWEVLTLCLAIRIALRHFRTLRRSSTGWTIRDSLTVMIKTHVIYFASFVAVSCFQMGYLSPGIMYSNSVGSDVYAGILEFVSIGQMFILGPRLILSVRDFNAKLVADSDAGIDLPSIVFQEGGRV
ncbi:hypothetical protein BDR05DRAFT_764308 [Suillus weaverae]|nr:hypothetical protein BDR05DRAFT_764308 [Suillus weaverae]